LASDAAAVGTIDPSDHVLIDRAFELGDQRVDDIFVPRLDVVAIRDDLPARDAFDVAISTGHRRIPIYIGDIDTVVGVVRLRDIAMYAIQDGDRPVSSFAREPLIVPESKRVIELLEDMQARNNHFAVVVDEFGGTAGIVTIEDIVERLVGSFSAEGTILTVSIPRGDWTTIAGLVIGLAGRIPGPGESVETDELRLTVLEASSRRIFSIEIERL
jgi:CBS domain containing-hemolysin-like protein